MRELLFTSGTADELADAIAPRIAEYLSRQADARGIQSPTGDQILFGRIEASRRLNLSPSTLDKLVRQKRVPSIVVGSRRLFDVNDVADALKNGRGANYGF